MKVLLMHPDEDFSPGRELPPESDDLVEDLGLGTLFQAMAKGDKLIFAVSKAALLSPLGRPEPVVYRQAVLADFTAHPELAEGLYSLATEALQSHQRLTFWGLNRSPESVRYTSVQALEMLTGYLVRLRRLVGEHEPDMASPALARLRSTVLTELGDDYMKPLQHHLNELKLPHGLAMSAQLGVANKGTAYMLHRVPPRRLRDRLAGRGPASYSFAIAERDESGMRALGELQARGVNIAANALAQSVEHVLSFFRALQTELAFYLGCLNLRSALTEKGEPICTPLPLPADQAGFSAAGLYDPCLSLLVGDRVVGNDVTADGKRLVVVTGANRGGKSTFLRSVGLAHLMMQAGMFVAATSFAASVARRAFTHFKRNEDTSMQGGKLDEELARMSVVVSHISPGCLLLCNEPFASTNEREGSDIGRQVFLPLVNAGVRVYLVTHLFDLAQSLYEGDTAPAVFLRAPRQGGPQPFKLVEGAPEPTAYGEDVYRRVFGRSPAGALATSPGDDPAGVGHPTTAS
ncbi:MAG: MutS-related protein [Acidimicrobiales bacterium]